MAATGLCEMVVVLLLVLSPRIAVVSAVERTATGW